MTTRFSGHLLTGNHASRPAASAVPDGTLYSCSTHSLIYQSNLTVWSTWATLGSGGAGSDLVQVVSGGGDVRIPGLLGSPDRLPASPNASDREFDSSTLAGTAVGTATTEDADTTRRSHYFIHKTGNGTILVTGRQWAWSPSNGDTVTCRQAWMQGSSTGRSGLFVGASPPGAMHSVGMGASTAFGFYVDAWSNPTTYASTPGSYQVGQMMWHIPTLFRIRYNTSTSVDFLWSHDGTVWVPLASAVNPGYTIGCFGLMVEPTSATDTYAMFDWIRVNWTP